jgi:hypothetical protein
LIRESWRGLHPVPSGKDRSNLQGT